MKNKIKNLKAFSLIELSIVILIVGIVVAGVTQSSRLISAFKLNSARTLTQSSPVASISDLAIWWESTSEKSFDAADQDDGLAVDNWYDINPQTTIKNNISQATANAQPLYKTSAINGLPALKFDNDATNPDYYENTSFKISDIAYNNEFTAFAVYKMLSYDTSVFLFGVMNDSSINYRIQLLLETGNMVFDYAGPCCGATGRITQTIPAAITNANVTTLTRTTSGVAKIRFNGAEILSSTMSANFTNAQLSQNSIFRIGSVASFAAGYSADMYLGELIIFKRALKAQEISDVENYLSKKWGVRF